MSSDCFRGTMGTCVTPPKKVVPVEAQLVGLQPAEK